MLDGDLRDGQLFPPEQRLIPARHVAGFCHGPGEEVSMCTGLNSGVIGVLIDAGAAYQTLPVCVSKRNVVFIGCSADIAS